MEFPGNKPPQVQVTIPPEHSNETTFIFYRIDQLEKSLKDFLQQVISKEVFDLTVNSLTTRVNSLEDHIRAEEEYKRSAASAMRLAVISSLVMPIIVALVVAYLVRG